MAEQEIQDVVALQVLVDGHVHAGKAVKKGSTIEVSKAAAAMLTAAWNKKIASDAKAEAEKKPAN